MPVCVSLALVSLTSNLGGVQVSELISYWNWCYIDMYRRVAVWTERKIHPSGFLFIEADFPDLSPGSYVVNAAFFTFSIRGVPDL